jgi:hypothetical protein
MREELVQMVRPSQRSFDDIKTEIDRALRAELKLAADDRNERARRCGIPIQVNATDLPPLS